MSVRLFIFRLADFYRVHGIKIFFRNKHQKSE
jgi:hypothetical protein